MHVTVLMKHMHVTVLMKHMHVTVLMKHIHVPVAMLAEGPGLAHSHMHVTVYLIVVGVCNWTTAQVEVRMCAQALHMILCATTLLLIKMF